MEHLFEKLKAAVVDAAVNPDFRHHKWYIKYHLEIVEQIAMELCDTYSHADRKLVSMLVWFHDYGKMLDFDDQYEKTLTEGKNKLVELQFPNELVEKIIHYIDLADKKVNLESNDTPIEIKILSSADGAAHLVGPFFALYWYENPDRAIDSLLEGNTNKALIDWEKKIVLPEVKKAFLNRHLLILEQSGKLPKKFL